MTWLALPLVAGLLGPSDASYELFWTAPPDCPDVEVVRKSIDRRLGTLPPNPSGTVIAKGEVTRVKSAGGVDFELRLELEAGTRELRSSRCAELADATGLIVAIAVNPDAALMADEDPPPPTPQAPPEPDPDQVPTPERPATPPAVPPAPLVKVWPLLRVSGVLAVGPLPRPSGGISGVIGAGGLHWRAEVEGAYLPPVAESSQRNTTVGGRFQLGVVAVRGCGVVGGRRLSSPRVGFVVAVPLCAAVELGGLRGEGFGNLDARRAVGTWLAVRVGPHLAVHPRSWRGAGLWLGAEAIAPVIRPSFDTQPSGALFSPAPAGFWAAAGLEFEVRSRGRRRSRKGATSQ